MTQSAKTAAGSVEKRSRPRPRLVESGRITSADGDFSFPCTILDMTEEGARVRFDEAVNLPAHFCLIAPRGRKVYLASLVWSKAPDYGIKFIRRVAK